MGLRDALRTWLTPLPAMDDERAYLPPPLPYVDNYTGLVNFGGVNYPLGHLLQQTLTGPTESVGGDYSGLTLGALQSNAVVYALEKERVNLFKQARPMWRQLRSGTPGELFSTPALDILRNPWPGGTTADLLSAMALSADIGGTAFIVRRPRHLAVLRPDWVTIVHGSPTDTDTLWDVDAEVLGLVYQPGGPAGGRTPQFYDRGEVAIFVPMRDPLAPTRGMSWLTPVIREIEADSSMTAHRLAFFRNGATPNLIVTGVVPAANQSLTDWVDKFRARNEGVRNAYRTMFFTAGVDAKVVGADLQHVDFKVVQGAGETRLAAAAGVPPVVVGLSEGMQGSSLNAGNFASAMRRFADLTGRPWWADAFASLATICPPPGGAELWYDDRFIPALKDDVKDAAEVQALNASAIRQLVDGGFEPGSVIDAVNAGDLKRLVHTGMLSVQLQEPGVKAEPEPEPPDGEPEAEEAPEPERGASARPFAERHLPGKHNQKTHGHGGGGASLTEAESQAAGRWSRTSGPIQAAARGFGDEGGIRDVELLDSALAKSPLAADETFHRGLNADLEWDGQMPMKEIDPEGTVWETKGGYRGTGLFANVKGQTREEAFANIGDATVGREFYHPGFLATTRGSHPMPEFDNAGHPVALRVKAPRGTPALDITPFSPHSESEVLLARGRTLRVTAARQVTKVDNWTRRPYDAWELDVEVINP